jgi:hypothetical protein
LDIQSVLNNKEIGPNKKLSVKIGLGVGECRILVVGGMIKRCEYLAVGEALRQACESETKASNGGETICSEHVYQYVSDNFEFEKITDDENFYKIISSKGERLQIMSEAYLMRKKFDQNKKLKDKFGIIKTFMPAAVGIYLEIEKEVWSKEIRMLTVMFLNLKVDLSQTRNESGLERIQTIVQQIQRSIYRTRGGLNKFLMDDKGSVMLICWGLPPMSHIDDHTRSVFSALTLIKELKKLNCGAYMGITTGTCFTGLCGTIGNRREYSLLGEIVNLSARYMQKAIYYAKEKKMDYCIFIDERTKNLVQNKIACEYVCQDELKGFSEIFNFYTPILDYLLQPTQFNPFPKILTHRDNPYFGKQNPSIHMSSEDFFNKSVYMVGRENELKCFISCLSEYITGKSIEIISIRGVTGSGKSLFLRKGLHEFLELNKELKNRYYNQPDLPFLLISYQSPITYTSPLNGFNKIMRDIYKTIINDSNFSKRKFKNNKYHDNDIEYIPKDCIGEILIESEAITMIEYLEEILKKNLSLHFETNNKKVNFKFLGTRDSYFEPRKVTELGGELKISEFFVLLLKKYKELLSLSFKYTPLIFAIEDAQYIDEMSIEFIRALRKSKLTNIVFILTYEEKISGLIKNQYDKILKAGDIVYPENTIYMENLLDIKVIKELIINHIAKQGKIIKTIDKELIRILISKSFRGVPLFILDLLDNLLSSKNYIQQLYTELIITSELLDMEQNLNWTEFNVPIRIERIVGSIIDQLSAKEIILLKCASVIGTIFDMRKLYNINPLNLSISELYSILSNLEKIYLIEFLNDSSPKELICKFNFPFFREILYQRMLIEQRTEVHSIIARTLQTSTIRYMSYNSEVKYLYWHLKISQKTLISYIEEDDADENKGLTKQENLNINNLKIFLIRDIINRLSTNDNGKTITCIKSGIIEKKSDKGPTWEDRYGVMSLNKFYYWYYEKDYKENKQPLGYFLLKDINKIKLLNDNQIGGRTNLFKISVTSWFKKEVQKGPRHYYFSVKSREEVIYWVISLNFLKVRVTYDEFSKNYGMVRLPLPHETKKFKKTERLKFTNSSSKYSNRFSSSSSSYSNNSSHLYNSIARKNTLSTAEKAGPSSDSHKLRQSFYINFHNNNETAYVESNVEIFNRVKNTLNELLAKGFIITFGCIQEIIFDYHFINEDKCFYIPRFMKSGLDDSDDISSKDDISPVTCFDAESKRPDKIIISPSKNKNRKTENEIVIINNPINLDRFSIEEEDESDRSVESSEVLSNSDGNKVIELSFDNKIKTVFNRDDDATDINKNEGANNFKIFFKNDTFSLGNRNNKIKPPEELPKEISQSTKTLVAINKNTLTIHTNKIFIKQETKINPQSSIIKLKPVEQNDSKSLSSIKKGFFNFDNDSIEEEDKKETKEEDGEEIYKPSVPYKIDLVPKYSDPKFDYLKRNNNLYKPYSSKLFQKLNK